MKALLDWVIIEPQEIESISGIITNTPDMFGENPPTRGIVISTGEGYMTESGIVRPCEIAPGDVVYFMKHSGAPLHKRQEDGKLSKYRVIRYSSILAKE